MKQWKIETTVQMRRVCYVMADTATEAQDKVDYMDIPVAHEEDVSEEIDDVSEVKSETVK